MFEATMSNSSHTSPTNGNQPLNLEAVPQVAPIAVLILLTNGIVFILFWKKRSLRTPSNYLLLSLAVSDFMTGLINIPVFLANFVQSNESEVLFGVMKVFHNVISFSIAYHITAVTAEKYLAVVNPFGRNMRTTKTVLKVAIVIWLWSSLLGTVPIFWLKEWLKREARAEYLETGYNIFCLVFVFLLPFTFILFAYCVMFRAVSSKHSLTKSMPQKGTQAFKKASNEKKCMIILLSMALTFVICWLPWFMLMLLFSLYNLQWLPRRVLVSLFPMSQIFLIVRYLSSIIDPLLYTFFKQDFWNAFRVVVLKKQPKGRSSQTLRVVSQRSRGGSEKSQSLLMEENNGQNSTSL